MAIQKESDGPSKLVEGPSEPLLPAPPGPRAEVAAGTMAPRVGLRRPWIWAAVLILVAVGFYVLWPKMSGKSTAATASRGAGKSGAGPVAAPVVAAKTRQGNIGVYFTALGTITPINTVTVKSRIDGQLLKVQYKEGELVHQGDVLVEIDPRPYQVLLTQAQGQLAKDQASLDNARIDGVRYQTLFAEGIVSEQQAATQKALVGQDEGAVKADQGQVDSARLNITYCHILAPITGRIGLRLVDQGNMVHASDPGGLLVITQMQPISALFTISEDELPAVQKKIAAGQKLTVEAYDRGMKNRLAEGLLTTLDNEIDPSTGTLKLRATFENQDNALFPNQFVNVRLLVEEKTGVTLAPSAAIQRNSQNTYVYVVKPDSTVTLRNVTIGATEGDDSEITSGLVPGEVIVLTGVDKLQEGSKVKAQIVVPGNSSQSDPANNVSNNSFSSASHSSSQKSGPRTKKGN